MIHTYKILHGIYDADVSPCLQLVQHYCRYDVWKYVFTQI